MVYLVFLSSGKCHNEVDERYEVAKVWLELGDSECRSDVCRRSGSRGSLSWPGSRCSSRVRKQHASRVAVSYR